MSEGLTLISLGALLLAAYAAHTLGARVYMPRVTLLLLVGVFGGPLELNMLPAGAVEWFREVSEMTLAMVGFCTDGANGTRRLIYHADVDAQVRYDRTPRSVA